jgi:hypothetical protein
MKKFWQVALKSLFIVTLWWVLLGVFVGYITTKYGVSPTFPYYQQVRKQANIQSSVWAHFDGVHYLKLAETGYVDEGTQAFFPVYPLLIKILSSTGLSYFAASRLISYLCLVGSIICIYYLFESRRIQIISALLLFPTSFYLASTYTESLFLLETLLFFILLKYKKFFPAAIVAGIASGTRLVGGALALSLMIELFKIRRLHKYLLFFLLLSLSGLIGYMYFLWRQFGDPLAFMHVQSMFGAGRSGSEVILLPQVFYRYLKILWTAPALSLLYGRSVLELGLFIIFGYLIWIIRHKLTWPILIFLIISITLPTLSGTLSSMPRYLLILVPFIISAIESKNFSIHLISGLLMLYLLSTFATGQFVS